MSSTTPDQTTLLSSEHVPARRMLYLMAKPPPAIREHLWTWREADKDRSADLLHVTLWDFGEIDGAPPGQWLRLAGLLRRFRARPFRIVFERIVTGAHTVLVGCEPMSGVLAYQRRLQALLRDDGLPIGRPRQPHLTLNYRESAAGAAWIEPVSWLVEEVLLVESVVGRTRHVEHGRWALPASAG